MEYERIHKPQTGIISPSKLSPSKLRAKLMGVSIQKKKDGSNCNSSRTSPSRLEDSEFVNNNLLSSNNDAHFYDSAVNEEPPRKPSGQTISSSLQIQNHCSSRENMDSSHVKVQQLARSDSSNSSAVHPLKCNDDENLDYDSNASSSSFEFHKGERMAHRSLTRSLSRPTSYKWNDAEKWIMCKQAGQGSQSKSLSLQNGGHRVSGMNMVRVVPEAASYEYRSNPKMPEMKRIDFCQPTSQMSLAKLNPAHPGLQSVPVQSNGANVPVDLYPRSKDMREVDNVMNSTHEVPGGPSIREISMRDMGTEMTPVTSQEPSRTATPNGSLTPLRSPTSSIPSTPRTGEPVSTPMERTSDNKTRHQTEKTDKELSEQELKLKTRREIVALGVQLGKMNIAAWASKDEKDKSSLPFNDPEELEHIENEKRAAAWEEAEKAKHAARYKREEIKIQAWESQQKAKLEEELRRIEAKVEQLRTHSQAKMMKKVAMAKKKSEEKRLAAEAQKKRHAERAAAQAEYIRQTGRNPPSEYICCGLLR
ncbi:uncharacterized protein LOC110728506 [Chenopodium quinoa]|uniref:Remorin C-terminal domain-containing protein n=1 Tax=Chenopodium quinoa TaxID=63459 RepID=A0A803MIN6_CHEQI|nr:uncharacterized protein LOC110728506 [Chenopodium quinoa]